MTFSIKLVDEPEGFSQVKTPCGPRSDIAGAAEQVQQTWTNVMTEVASLTVYLQAKSLCIVCRDPCPHAYGEVLGSLGHCTNCVNCSKCH